MQNRPQVWPGRRREATRTAVTGDAHVCCFTGGVCLRHRARAISPQRARCYSMNLPTVFAWPQPLEPGAQEGLARGLPHRHVQAPRAPLRAVGWGPGAANRCLSPPLRPALAPCEAHKASWTPGPEAPAQSSVRSSACVSGGTGTCFLQYLLSEPQTTNRPLQSCNQLLNHPVRRPRFSEDGKSSKCGTQCTPHGDSRSPLPLFTGI